MAQRIDLDAQTCAFFDHLHRGGTATYWWYLDDIETYVDKDGVEREKKRTVWYPVGKRPGFVNPGATEHAFFGVHPTTNTKERYQRATVKDIAAINCLFAEFDGNKTLEDVLAIEPAPSCVVCSSPGKYHAYWLLDQPYHIHTDLARKWGQDTQYAWVDYVEGDDASKDITRVLRVPGTKNVKAKYAPDFPVVTWVHGDMGCYRIEDLRERVEGFVVMRSAPETPQNGRIQDGNVIGAFNAAYSIEACLSQYGYTHRPPRWVRPGGSRALTVVQDGRSFHHSGEDPLCDGYWKKPFDLFCYYEHNGDVKAAVRAAAEMLGMQQPKNGAGVGQPKPTRADEQGQEQAGAPARDEHIAVQPFPLLPVDLPNETLAGLAEELDKGDSELLVALYPHELRYDHRHKSWFYWNGVYWEKDTGDAMLRSILSTQVRAQYQSALIPLSSELVVLQEKEKKNETDNERVAKLKRWCEALAKRIKTLATTGGCKNVATFAQSYLSFCGDWNTVATVLPCKNGYVDLHTGKLNAPDPAMSFTHIIPFDYNPNAEAPKWQAFLDAMQPDAEMQDYLQTYAGYATTGVAEEICAFFIGSGANGKTTFCNVLAGILGAFCAELNAESLLEQKGRQQNFDIAAVEGARLVVARELPSGTLSASTLKQLVDIGKLHIERKYEQPYDIERTHSLIIYANETPRIKDTTDGTWRRLHLVRWDYAVPEDQRVENYHRHIIQEEAEGVLAWIVGGAQRYIANGVKKPAGVRQATESYRVAEDEVALFIAQFCVTGDRLFTPAKDLYEAYCEFADRNMSQRVFGKEMTKRFGDTQGRRISGKKIRCYVGIGLLNGDDEGDVSADEGETGPGTEMSYSVPGAFKASQSLKTYTKDQTGTDGTKEQVKVQKQPSCEGSCGTFTDQTVPSVPVVNKKGDKNHHKATDSTGTELSYSVPDAKTTHQERAAAQKREEDYRIALLAKLITPDMGRNERTRLYEMDTSELESLVYPSLVEQGRVEEARRLADLSSEPQSMHRFISDLMETIETA